MEVLCLFLSCLGSLIILGRLWFSFLMVVVTPVISLKLWQKFSKGLLANDILKNNLVKEMTKRSLKQECIPVGFVLSAAVAISWGWGEGGGFCQGGVCPGGVSAQGVSAWGVSVWGGVCWGGVCLPGGGGAGPLRDGIHIPSPLWTE